MQNVIKHWCAHKLVTDVTSMWEALLALVFLSSASTTVTKYLYPKYNKKDILILSLFSFFVWNHNLFLMTPKHLMSNDLSND